MKLAEICEELTYTCLQGEMEKEISDIIYDSRKVEKDTIFVCMVGAVVDGHDFVEDAVKKGAAALVVEHAVEIDIPENCTVLQVEDARYALAIMSAAFFGHPDRELTTIGLTGTKGKTTTTYMIKSVLEEAGKKVGLIGTIGALIGEEKLPAKNTTPESYELHKMFRAMVDAGCEYVVMEVSSQGLKHYRVEGITFAHTSWMRPSYQGHVTLQGGFPLLDAYKLHEPGLPEKAELENQAWIARPETAIRVRGTEHLTFSRCRFRHLASTGLDYEWAVSSSGIENCVFSDIGGTGILIGAFPDGGFETHVPFIPPEERNLCTDITIKNNLITDVTNEDWGCVGIGAGYVSGIDISHNEVCHLNYSGICVGWGWTSLESGMKNNRIEANYVHHFARRLYDAGGLYTLSNQPGSVMRNNRIEHLEEAPYATNDRAFYIYLDEATDGYTIENNWCPTERFDSNRPGNRNVWKNNGPQVTESIKNKAGRIKPE